jgi:hypothetical protein
MARVGDRNARGRRFCALQPVRVSGGSAACRNAIHGGQAFEPTLQTLQTGPPCFCLKRRGARLAGGTDPTSLPPRLRER